MKRVCPCPSLPEIGIHYPCIWTVDGNHVYATERPVEPRKGSDND